MSKRRDSDNWDDQPTVIDSLCRLPSAEMMERIEAESLDHRGIKAALRDLDSRGYHALVSVEVE